MQDFGTYIQYSGNGSENAQKYFFFIFSPGKKMIFL